MFTGDDGDFKVQVACNLPTYPELKDPVDGPGLSAVTDSPDLNLVMGSTILQEKTDFRNESAKKLRRMIQLVRYDSLANQGGYRLPGKDVARKGMCYCGACGETFSLVLLRRNTTFKGRKVGGLPLKISAVLEMEEIDDLKLDGLLGPCGNCRDVLRQAGVDVWRFRKSLVDTGAVGWFRNRF